MISPLEAKVQMALAAILAVAWLAFLVAGVVPGRFERHTVRDLEPQAYWMQMVLLGFGAGYLALSSLLGWPLPPWRHP